MLGQAQLMGFVGASDREQARVFYGHVLGLKLLSDEPFALVFEVNGVMLRVTFPPAVTAAPYTVLGWQVEDIAATVIELTRRDVVFERLPGFTQDALGIFRFEDGTQVAWFKDPDGNMLSVTQMG